MLASRPTLLEQLAEVHSTPPHVATSVLLGRTNGTVHSGKKPVDESVRTPAKAQFCAPSIAQPASPRSMPNLFSPLACTSPGFTPISTPSPSSGFAAYEQKCFAAPGVRAAVALRSQCMLQGWLAARATAETPDQEQIPAAAVAEHAASSVVEVPLADCGPDQFGSIGRDDDEDDSDIDEILACPGMAISMEEVPPPPPGALHPSVGSANHALGACKRCCFFPRGRCANGYNCEFCHYEHEKRRRKNKRKSKDTFSVHLPHLSASHTPFLQCMANKFGGASGFGATAQLPVHAGATTAMQDQRLMQSSFQSPGFQSMVRPALQGMQYVPMASCQAEPMLQMQPLQCNIPHGGMHMGAVTPNDHMAVYQMNEMQPQAWPMSEFQPATMTYHLPDAVSQQSAGQCWPVAGCFEAPPPPLHSPMFFGQ